MTRGIWLLAGLCLVVACSREQARPAVLVETATPAERPMQEDEVDRVVAALGWEPAIAASPTPTSAPSVARASESTAALTIGQSTTPTPTPSPPRPRPTTTAPPPVVPTAAPTATGTPVAPLPGCVASLEVSEVDGTVRAAQTLPALFFGGGLCAGDKVEALIGGKSCGAATVNSAGQWSISIRPNAACGPTDGASVTLTVNGKTSTAQGAVSWKRGGLPPDITNGYSLNR